MEICIFILFWNSVLVRAFGWVAILRSKGFANEVLLSLGFISEPLVLVRTEFAVILGKIHFMISFAIFPIASVIRQLDNNTLLASRGMGVTASFTFLNAFLPMTLAGVMAAAKS